MNSMYDYEAEYGDYVLYGKKNGKTRTDTKGVTVFIYKNTDSETDKKGEKGVVFFCDALDSDKAIKKVGIGRFIDTIWKISFDCIKSNIDKNSLKILESQKEYNINGSTLMKYLEDNEE